MGLPVDMDFAALSAGQKRRVLLARGLVEAPQLLLLDEPTNHLDLASIEWLETFLLEWGGALLFVTHDRAFLRKLATRIVDSRGGGYVLDRHYALPPINLNAREAALLVALGTHAVRMRLLPFTSTVQSALDKVRGALSASSQREASGPESPSPKPGGEPSTNGANTATSVSGTTPTTTGAPSWGPSPAALVQ
jgi:ATPase subunit of ABC transporter with duplicated ATPase domains